MPSRFKVRVVIHPRTSASLDLEWSGIPISFEHAAVEMIAADLQAMARSYEDEKIRGRVTLSVIWGNQVHYCNESRGEIDNSWRTTTKT